MKDPTHDRGSASVLLLSFVVTLLFVGAALGVVAALVRAHRTAAAAADLAALAGAQAVARGADGCAAAEDLARRNLASVTTCRIDGRDVVVTVTAPGPKWLEQTADLTAEARAGPEGDEP